MIAALALLIAGDPTIVDAMHAAIDPCRQRGDDTAIVVCGRTPSVPDHDRLPQLDTGWDPAGAARSVSGERNDLLNGGTGAGDLTAGSCSAVGASGFTGCQIRTWRSKDQQKGWWMPRTGRPTPLLRAEISGYFLLTMSG